MDIARFKKPIDLGNPFGVKDGGYDRGYAKGMWVMILQDYSDDFVLGTGEFHIVFEFSEPTFNGAKIELKCIDSGLKEVGLFNNETMVKVRRQFYRPLESDNYMAG